MQTGNIIIFAALSAFAISMAVWTYIKYKNYSRLKQIFSQIDRNTPQFLSWIESELKKTKSKKWRNHLLLNKISGLQRMGRWEEIRQVLELIDVSLFSLPLYRGYCSSILSMLLAGETALAEYAVNKLGTAGDKYPEIVVLRKLHRAILDYYAGVADSSKRLEALVEGGQMGFYEDAHASYYLAQLAKDTDIEAAKEYFEKCITLAEGKAVARKAQAELKNMGQDTDKGEQDGQEQTDL